MEEFKRAGAARLRPILAEAKDPVRAEYDAPALAPLNIHLSPDSIVNPRPAEPDTLKRDLIDARTTHHADEPSLEGLSAPRRAKYWRTDASKHSAYTWARRFAKTLALLRQRDDATMVSDNGGYPPHAVMHELDMREAFELYLVTGATTGCRWRVTKLLSCGEYHGCVLAEERAGSVPKDKILRGEMNCLAAMFASMFLQSPVDGKPELPKPVTIITFTKTTVRVLQASMTGGADNTTFPISVHIPLQMPILNIFWPGKNADRAWESLIAWGRFYVSGEEDCGACVLRELEIAAGVVKDSPFRDDGDDDDDEGEDDEGVVKSGLGGDYHVAQVPELSKGWVSDLPGASGPANGEKNPMDGWQEVIGSEERAKPGHKSVLSWFGWGFRA